jgi:hypothetical protein
MTVTVFLAELIGIVAMILAFAGLCQRKVMLEVIKQLTENRALLYVLGVIDVMAATALILIHNDWSGGALSLVVTLFGWALLVKGFLRLTLTDAAIKWILKTLCIERCYYWYMMLILFVGIALTWAAMMTAIA